jgi:Ca2+/H+ antiporter, TMEM165/GDT1 family
MNPNQTAAVVILVIFGIAIFALLMAIPTFLLWNWLMPTIFGLKEITLWQALGINFLSGIFFKTTNFAK